MVGKAAEYAIRALVYICMRNLEGKTPGFREVAKEIESPEPYTAKILQTLARSRMLSSVKGRGGGFFFRELTPEASPSLYDVITQMGDAHMFTSCGFGLKHCDEAHPCPLHEEYLPIRDGFYRLVRKETIYSLAQKVMKQEAVINRLMN